VRKGMKIMKKEVGIRSIYKMKGNKIDKENR
jgi:hypothetical protein